MFLSMGFFDLIYKSGSWVSAEKMFGLLRKSKGTEEGQGSTVNFDNIFTVIIEKYVVNI